MHWGPAAWLQLITIVAILALLHVPLGNYIASVYSSERHWRAERLIYRLAGVQPDREQHWVWYAASVVAFSVVSVAVLFGLLMLQTQLPAPWGSPGMTPLLALNTAVSFVTNTSWQNYAGESALGHFGLTVGLGVQAFASSAVGIAVAIALMRGIVRRQTFELGNFWVDLVRGIIRILIPMALIIAILLTALGVMETFGPAQAIGGLAGGSQTLPSAPVASWESIKLMSGDGGGAFNANSAHPFENPTPLTNVIEIVTMAVIPVSLVRTYGVMVGDRRQGWALLAVVVTLFGLGTAAVGMSEALPHGTVTSAVGTALEGKEIRFGIPGSAQFGQVATATADGAANSSYDSFTSVGGGVLMANMMLSEISPGGTGSGLYGLVVIALLAVFLGGLMIGRTPEYLGKRVSAREMKLVSLALLTPPVTVLTGVAISMALPAGATATTNSGPHGLSEVLYAFTSCVAGNGSAFGGFSGNTTGFNIGLAVAMIIGRFVPMMLVISLAASFARQSSGAITGSTLRTHQPSFVGLMIGAALIVVGLEYLPALALGPIAERLS
jgi:K+-transporting ATPase KdpA subunit